MIDDIKKIIGDLILTLGLSFEEIVVEEKEAVGMTRFSVHTKDSGLLIGGKGQNYLALNHIVKKLVAEKYPESKFMFDINDYQNKNMETVKNKALLMAERARSFQTNIEMDPMSSYERMIVHATLAEVKDIRTESSGFGENRHVVIQFVNTESIL